MKLASYDHKGRTSFGVVTDAGLVDIPAHWPDGPANLRAALAGGTEALAAIAKLALSPKELIPLDSVRLLPPITDPPKLIGLAVNYVAHHDEVQRPRDLPADATKTTTPRPFLMPPTSLAGCGDEIPWPVISEDVDYEVELAVVIGREGRCIAAEDALDYVGGYTIANDISARTVTHTAGRTERPKDPFFDWLHGKWPDGFFPTGPWLVTPDEVGNPDNLDIQLAVNGEIRQNANTSLMIFNVAEIISFVSHVMTLQVGDVIATGTPSGVGMATGDYRCPGDTLTCRIETLGELTNVLGPHPESFYRPCSRGGASS